MEILVTGKDPAKVPEIEKKVEEQGNKVRQMKTEKKDKKDIDQAVTGNAQSSKPTTKSQSLVSGLPWTTNENGALNEL